MSFVFQITNELKLLDKKIIECTYDGKQWVFLKHREDKSYPNSYATAQSKQKLIVTVGAEICFTIRI